MDDQRGRTVGRAPALHRLTWVPPTHPWHPIGSPSLEGLIPERRARSEPCAQLGVSPKLKSKRTPKPMPLPRENFGDSSPHGAPLNQGPAPVLLLFAELGELGEGNPETREVLRGV